MKEIRNQKPENIGRQRRRFSAPSFIRHSALLAFFAFLCGHPSPAADKNGVGPNTISLPKGPGAIEGLGESFQPHLNTGTAGSGMGFKLPPGTAGQLDEPRPTSSGAPDGWFVGLRPRSECLFDKGIPTYGANVGFSRPDVFINDAREELVPQATGYFFCKNEGAFIRYQFVPSLAHPMGEGWGEGYWVWTSPNGTLMDFGLTAAGRVQDPNNTNHIFSWLLQRETDTHGNVIVYSYTNFPGSNNLNQKYLSGIAYGPGSPPWANFHFVVFNYEDRPDWFEDCRSGFIVRTGKRLKELSSAPRDQRWPTICMAILMATASRTTWTAVMICPIYPMPAPTPTGRSWPKSLSSARTARAACRPPLMAIAVGPSPPLSSPSILPETDCTSWNCMSAWSKRACASGFRLGRTPPAPAAPPRGPVSCCA